MWTCPIPEDDITVISTNNTHDILYIDCPRLPSDVNLLQKACTPPTRNIESLQDTFISTSLSSCNINLLFQGAL